MAITWRDVQAQNQRDSLLARQQGISAINRGLSGLQNTVTGLAQSQEQDVLDDVLNRIGSINTVAGVNQARENPDLLSGLNAQGQIQARNALDRRLNSLYQSDQAANQFEQRQTQQREQPILNEIGRLEANRDFAGARKLAEQLSNPGAVLERLRTGETQAANTASLKDAKEALYFNLGGINRSREGNREISNNLLTEFPYLSDGLKIGKDGQLALKDGLSNEQKEQYTTALNEVNQQYSQAASYNDLNQQVLQRAFSDPNLSVSDVQGLLNTIGAVQSVDPVVQEQAQRQALNQRLAESAVGAEQQVLSQQQSAFEAANPVDPALSRRDAGSNQDVINSYANLTEDGDLEAFSEDVNDVIRDLGQENFDFTPEALKLALDEMGEINEARSEGGGLGSFFDTFSDSEKEALKVKIREKQRLIDNDANIRQSINQNAINTIRGRASLEQELLRRLSGQ